MCVYVLLSPLSLLLSSCFSCSNALAMHTKQSVFKIHMCNIYMNSKIDISIMDSMRSFYMPCSHTPCPPACLVLSSFPCTERVFFALPLLQHPILLMRYTFWFICMHQPSTFARYSYSIYFSRFVSSILKSNLKEMSIISIKCMRCYLLFLMVFFFVNGRVCASERECAARISFLPFCHFFRSFRQVPVIFT